MAENPNQPDKKRTKSVSELAQVGRLAPFNDLDLLGNFAERFPAKTPDEYFVSLSFSTLTAFTIMWKEKSEYHQRFNYFWSETKPEGVTKG